MHHTDAGLMTGVGPLKYRITHNAPHACALYCYASGAGELLTQLIWVIINAHNSNTC